MQNDDVDLGPRKKGAKALAQELIKSASVLVAPVSLQVIIEHLQKTNTLAVRRIIASEKVSGLIVMCTQVDSEYATIAFNGNLPWCRRRFTIAHEIGHFLFGHDCTKNQEDGSRNEAEANAFAAELLIPTSFLKKDFSKIRNVQELAKLYRVSEQALTIKLMEARLV